MIMGEGVVFMWLIDRFGEENSWIGILAVIVFL